MYNSVSNHQTYIQLILPKCAVLSWQVVWSSGIWIENIKHTPSHTHTISFSQVSVGGWRKDEVFAHTFKYHMVVILWCIVVQGQWWALRTHTSTTCRCRRNWLRRLNQAYSRRTLDLWNNYWSQLPEHVRQRQPRNVQCPTTVILITTRRRHKLTKGTCSPLRWPLVMRWPLRWPLVMGEYLSVVVHSPMRWPPIFAKSCHFRDQFWQDFENFQLKPANDGDAHI